MSKLIDAVSVVFCFEDKIFYIKRQNYLKAFPGYMAFPGGKVDKEDHTELNLPSTLKAFPHHLMNALVREMKEEMSFDTVEALISGEVEEVHYLGVAITPDFNPVRFATHFFRLNLKRELPFTAHLDEAKECGWKKPTELLSQFESGNLLVVPPIIKLVKYLCDKPDLTTTVDFDFHYDPTLEVPMLESIKGVRQLPVLSNTLFPATRTNCFVLGDEGSKRYVLDPSPKDHSEYIKMVYVLKKLKVTDVMLTHHHGDHNEFAPDLARDLSIPLSMSADTQMRLTKINGKAWFDGTVIHTLKEGDTLTKWLGEDVKIFEIPGHDEGHLGVAPISMKWFIVGDLFQGVGTVVIGGAEGSMRKYFTTLERIIKLAPHAVFPSHGIALGGTHILEKTLEHRQLREDQVLEMYQQGKTKEEMLKTIYFDLDERLFKYAMANIESHLQKLQEDRKI